jgi:DNA primase
MPFWNMLQKHRIPHAQEYYPQYLPSWKIKGNRGWAQCPFHNDTTPSLAVNLDSDRWKCFGCGESGGVIDFHMKFNNLEFKEACKDLGCWGRQRD